MDVVLGPGESVYVPARCWHYVRALTTSVSVNFCLLMRRGRKSDGLRKRPAGQSLTLFHAMVPATLMNEIRRPGKTTVHGLVAHGFGRTIHAPVCRS